MDVLAQALNVVARAEAATGRVALTLDLNEPAHRAAYAAAIAVLRMSGIDAETLLRPVDGDAPPLSDRATVAEQDADSDLEPGPGFEPDGGSQDAQLRRDYEAALTSLTDDADRRKAVIDETFPRVRELLRDGANVEAVAQIQYRRWVEDHLGAVR
jgi:hypothetical protein